MVSPRSQANMATIAEEEPAVSQKNERLIYESGSFILDTVGPKVVLLTESFDVYTS